MAQDVALRVGEERSGGAPAGRVGLLALDVRGNGIAVEVPDGDAVRLERVREHASGLQVEAVAVRGVARLLVRAAGVVAV